jgi:hypothetical protein
VPRFRRRIADSTDLDAFFPYLAIRRAPSRSSSGFSLCAQPEA